jgi:ABC-2 type transport system ATP-binding protein
MAGVLFNEVKKSYDAKNTIFSDVSFSIELGSVFGLLGLNGAGKTTIIKSILSLTNIQAGSITIDGIDNANNLARAGVFYLPEKFSPSRFLTAYEFLTNYLRIFNGTTPNKEQIDFYCDNLDIDKKYLGYKISACSKGTVQKIGLLLAFLSNANLLILDEPSSGLDVKARSKLKSTIAYYKALGKSVFLSSHIFSDVEDVCDKFMIFDKGQIKFIGSKEQILQNVQNANCKNIEEYFLYTISA